MRAILGTPYEVDDALADSLKAVSRRVSVMRSHGALSPDALGRLRRFFKIKNIYNSNAIEGNILDIGETRLVVEQGLTLTGRPLKDQAEAKNLSEAIDYLEGLATDLSRPITQADIRQLHYFVLKDIRDEDAGKYRCVEVEIGGSEYKPPSPDRVPTQMNEFSAWLATVSLREEDKSDEAILMAAAAHAWFVTIHPFIDGNGRVGRLLLNLILMRFGCPIAIVTKADRSRYYDALEISQSSDLTALCSLLIECIEESLEEYEVAADEQREHDEWTQAIVGKLQHAEQVRASNEYEVWRNAMELLKSVFRQTAEKVDSSAMLARVWFKDFGQLELEKYLLLKTNESAKRTWFFRIDFRSGEKKVRYLFFFGSQSHGLRNLADVTLFLAREEPPGSFNYVRLDYLTASNVPKFAEIGYDPRAEEFIVRDKFGSVNRYKIERLCREFFEDVVQKHFGN